MRDIDRIAEVMAANFTQIPAFEHVEAPIRDFVHYAKVKTENLRTDPNIFDVWAQLVTAAERLASFAPAPQALPDGNEAPRHGIADGLQLIHSGRNLIFHIARATQEHARLHRPLRGLSGNRRAPLTSAPRHLGTSAHLPL